MIERLQVRGFKSLLDVDVELGPLTVFVGANGSGKTSVLEAINELRREPTFWNDQQYLSWFSRVLNRQAGTETINIRATTTFDGGTEDLERNFATNTLDQLRSRNVKENMPLIKRTQRFQKQVGMFRLDASAMADSSYSGDLIPSLDFDGSNLAAVLDALQGTRRECFDEIERRMKTLVPSLERLRVPRARIAQGSHQLIGHQVAFDFQHAVDIRADDASEGTLLLLGLITIIESKPPDQPMTIMLDDLDRALHPKAQQELVGYLHELIRTRPGLQIIATTHSPYLVEHLAFEEVRAITLAEDGTSVIGSLADHPEAERWRDEMSAGEFWSAVGESWVAQKRSGT